MSEIKLKKYNNDNVEVQVICNDKVIFIDEFNSEMSALDYLSSLYANIRDGFSNIKKEGF